MFYFGGTLPVLYGAKTAILGNIFHNILVGGLLFHGGKEYRKLKTMLLIIDYQTMSAPNMVGCIE